MGANDPLQPLLDEAEAKLRRRLREACEVEAQGVSSESAAEIRKLEDSLLSAAMAAEQVLTVRRHMKRHAGETVESSGAGDGGPAHSAQSTVADKHARQDAGGTRVAVAEEQATATAAADAQDDGSPEAGGETTTLREFTDCRGRTWRAWPVTPNTERARPSSLRTLGEFQEGWICFESVDDSARRRLPRQAPRWSELRQEELERLLDEAISVPGRKVPRADAAREPDIRLH